MSEKQTYWLADPDGRKALVAGVEQRARWVPLGWQDSTEPAGTEQVWLRHDVTGGRALFAAQVLDVWAEKGWHPSDPPEPESLFNTPPAAPQFREPAAVKPKTAAPAAETKEK